MPAYFRGRAVPGWSYVLVTVCLAACQTPATRHTTSIEFDHVPPPDVGGTGTVEVISGTVRNAPHGARIVVYVQSRGSWYVQPLGVRPFTTIGKDGRWSTLTHLGTTYAAVLAGLGHQPAKVLTALPSADQTVLAVKTVPGDPTSVKPPHLIRFSSYDWTVRQTGSDRHGAPHHYKISNASVDAQGYLHLRVTKQDTEWTCGEVALPRSLGYGRYEAVVSGTDQLEPATVFDMFTWDRAGTDQNRREINTQFARWGDPKAENGEFSVQPYYRPANAYRYTAVGSPLLLTMLWQSGRVSFNTSRIDASGRPKSNVAEHTFTADIPAPASESIHLNLCVFDYGKVHQASDSEVVVKSFRYLP